MMSTGHERNAAAAALPAVDGDFYQIAGLLSKEEQQLLGRVRAFMEAHVAPIINHYWVGAAFPFDILPGFRALGIAGTPYQGYGCPARARCWMVL
jgi:glutaryl-CoA dehydrogenase